MEEGRVLQDRYDLRSVLGESDYAVTHLAEDRRTGQRCVVKSLPLRKVEDVKAVELFEREARVLAHLDHPRIPRFLEAFTTEDGTVMHLVQSFVPGKDLARLVKDGQHFTEARAVQIARDVAEVLAYLHAFSPPIIHRDIKPTNVVLGPDGRAHLVDFGAARDKLLHDREPFGGGSTIVGTWGYMPYEQFSGRALPASDIFGLGTTLVFCLSRKEPVEMDRDGRRIDFARHVNVSRGFREVLARMVEPDWEDRYASAGELLAALDALAGRGPARPRLFSARTPVVAAGLVLTGVVLGALLVRQRAPSPEAAPAASAAAAGTASPWPPARRPPPEEGPPVVAAEEQGPVRPVDGVLHVDIHRDFKYQDSGWPMHLSVGQTEARGPDVRPFEALAAEPRYASSEVLYGYLLLGNGRDPRYTWVLDERERPTWVVWFDRNNNEDLTDDGPPLPNQGTGRLAVDLVLAVDVVRRTGEVLRQPYHLWFWVNENPKGSEYLRPLA
ncbi:MAG TPA: serine/threonine-protein kinase, partial [Vicinamibacteria bacterium]